MHPFIQKVKSRTPKIAVAAHSTADLGVLADAVKFCGMEVLHQGVIKQAVSVLESEPVDWFITTLGLEDETNLFNLLKLCTQFTDLGKVMMTVVLPPGQAKRYLPFLLEWGLFSYIIVEIKAGDGVKQAMAKSVAEIESASDPLRYTFEKTWSILQKLGLYHELQQLCSSAISVFPGNAKILYQTAKAQFLAGEKEKGEQTLAQILLLDPASKDNINKLAQEHLGRDIEIPEQIPIGNGPFGPTTVVGIGLSPTQVKELNTYLGELGVEIEFFARPTEFMEWIEAGEEPTIVLPAWVMEEIPGAVFIQRLRTAGYVDCKICPIGVDFDDNDNAILAEMGTFDVLKTPFERRSVLITLIGIMQKERQGYDSRVMLQKIKNHLSKEDLTQANTCLQRLEASGRAAAGVIDLAYGEIAYFERDYETAKKHAEKSFKVTTDPVSALNLLGKSCMKLGDFETAFNCFDDAQSISPLNVSRLCKIAESQMQLGHNDEAKETLEDASSIDSDNQEVIGAKAKLSLNTGDIDVANESMAQLGEISDIVAFLNNKAVTKSLEGDFEESANLYNQAIKAIPAQHEKYKTTIHFNLGLMHLREQKTQLAIDAFTQCSPKHNEELAKRAYDIIATIHKAKKLNKEINLASDKKPVTQQEKQINMKKINRDLNRTSASLKLKKGDRLCFLFFVVIKRDAQVDRALKKVHMFKPKLSTEVDGKRVWV
ncbi:MAG: tetratricopeptide repeat protein [Zetaproteobacteria bacterium]|nr:tetratricopeptide repeat protein [Zetaproteobacteria bacterium]